MSGSSPPARSSGLTLGVTVMPEYVQAEGIDHVLENVLGRCRAATVAIAPSLLEPDPDGSREPPSDSGKGLGRVLDRPLWGRRELNVRSAPSFVPDTSRYTGQAFGPPESDDLTEREGGKVTSFLDALKREGVETQIQLTAAMPPGYRVQSRGRLSGADPLTVDGRTVTGRVDANLSLAHAELRGYVSALIHDLIAYYPQVDVMRFDWPEYPPYHPDSLLFDFHPAAVELAESRGFDVAGLKAGLADFAKGLPDLLSAESLERLAGEARFGLLPLDDKRWSVLSDQVAYRRLLAMDYVNFLADTVKAASGGRVKCNFLCFAPPFNTLSGFAIDEADRLASDIGIKVYSMHWSMIERAYVERLLELGAGDADAALRLVRTLLGVASDLTQTFDDVRYPDPDEPHAAGDDVLEAKIGAAKSQTRHANLWALTHSYGPVDDMMRRFRAAARVTDYVHINRYGYIGDDKIAALADFMADA